MRLLLWQASVSMSHLLWKSFLPLLLPILLPLLTWSPNGGLACFAGQRHTARVDENPMTEWSSWTNCDLPCGVGKETRWRSSIILTNEREIQSRQCGVACDEVYEWSSWLGWSNCSLSCGAQGVRSRFRECRRVGDGYAARSRVATCPGDWMQAEACNQFDCPAIYMWMQWTDWTPCTTTCGKQGSQDRSRQCQSDRLDIAEPDSCGTSSKESRACNTEVQCPELPEWQTWSQWSSCSTTCGPASTIRKRERSCRSDQQPHLCIIPDVVKETEQRDCNNPVCPPVNGGWNHWNPWSNCLVTCGWGYRVRNRLCNNPPPSNGGSDCGSSSAGYERCLGGECPVDGHWGQWAPCTNVQGSQCATTPRGQCTSGFAMYCRHCDNPPPEFGGSPCITGLATDRRECWNTEACNNNIVQPPMKFTIVGFLNTSDLLVTWLRAPYGLPASSFFITWSVTGTDSVGETDVPAAPQKQQNLLGESYKYWIRGLTANAVLDISIATRSTAGGAPRISEALRKSFQVSRVDGGWGEWGFYGGCSPTADCNIPGTRSRSRKCDRPPPANGGVTCPGLATEVSRCFHPC